MTGNGRQRGTLLETVQKELRDPVAAPPEDREVGLVPGRHEATLRHALVPAMGLRPPGGGAGDTLPLPAQDAWVDEALGRMEGRRGGEPDENLETSALKGLVRERKNGNGDDRNIVPQRDDS